MLRLLEAKLRGTSVQRTQGSTTLRASAVGLSRPTEGGSRRLGGAEQLLLAPDLAASVAQRVAADRPVGTLPVGQNSKGSSASPARPKRCKTLELDPPATSSADHGTVAAPTLSSTLKAASHLGVPSSGARTRRARASPRSWVCGGLLGEAGEVVVSGRWPACQMSIHAQVSREGRRCWWRHWQKGRHSRSEVFVTLRSRGTRASSDAVVY